MNWTDTQTWKDCFVSTTLCLAGCSIGTMGVLYYMANQNFWLAFAVSAVVGLLACVLFIIIWNVAFRKINFKDALKSSIKMSFVSMLIMIVAENLIMYFTRPQHMTDMQQHSAHNNWLMMIVAMAVGFLLALPYNYYQLSKTGAACHTG